MTQTNEFDVHAAAQRIIARHAARETRTADIFDEVQPGHYVRFRDRDGETRLFFVRAKYPLQRQLLGQVCECLTRNDGYIDADQIIGFFMAEKGREACRRRWSERFRHRGGQAAAPRIDERNIA